MGVFIAVTSHCTATDSLAVVAAAPATSGTTLTTGLGLDESTRNHCIDTSSCCVYSFFLRFLLACLHEYGSSVIMFA